MYKKTNIDSLLDKILGNLDSNKSELNSFNLSKKYTYDIRAKKFLDLNIRKMLISTN